MSKFGFAAFAHLELRMQYRSAAFLCKTFLNVFKRIRKFGPLGKKGDDNIGTYFWIASLCTYEFPFFTVLTEPEEGLKISYLGGHNLPPVEIGLTDLPKHEGGEG